MDEIEKYLESHRALDKNGKPNESLFGVKIYKSLKATKISQKLYNDPSVYYELTGELGFYWVMLNCISDQLKTNKKLLLYIFVVFMNAPLINFTGVFF